MAVTKPTGAPAPAKVGYAQAIRDVFITSINKGQFPFAILGAIVLLLIWRIPEHEIVPLIHWIFETLGSLQYLGFLLFALTVFFWYFHAQRMRREFTEQLNAFKAGQKAPKPGK
ncbi:hypothetical protein QTI51_24575 [Variovorax sp. J22G73]|uniref:hypothetical protein n=1 Tax=unclassified Variovorax TaxID=663243 RepID=UPI002576D002|nr:MULTISPECIES: hypothetical protein [unclassified Variovorax]MDM0007902.1 hypothetical protein [Variovorax sp. J22R203]MDM0100475.1 hypothetical protein [Variovorax sp. J22G73]